MSEEGLLSTEGVADIYLSGPAVVYFFQTVGGVLFSSCVVLCFSAKRAQNFGLFWPLSANFSYFVGRTFWCTFYRPK